MNFLETPVQIVDRNEIPLGQPVKLESEQDVIELCQLGQQMAKICEINRGAGLSAVQVGMPLNFFVLRVKPLVYRYLFNCKYEPDKRKGMLDSIEGCLSLRDEDGDLELYKLKRFKKIKLIGKELDRISEVDGPLVPDNEPFDERMFVKNIVENYNCVDDHTGIVLQHEIDHQLGVLISKIGSPHKPEKRSYSISDLRPSMKQAAALRMYGRTAPIRK